MTQRILVDTNILLRSVDPSHPHFAVAVGACEFLREQGNALCLVPQNIYEFWAVATRPIDVNGLGLTFSEADEAVSDFLRLFTLLRDERTVFERWREIVTQHQVHGVQSHDARLAAAMKRHGIEQILTFDLNVFRRFADIEVLDPAELITT